MQAKILSREGNILTVRSPDGDVFTVDLDAMPSTPKFPIGTRLAFPGVERNPQRVTRHSGSDCYHGNMYQGQEHNVTWAPEAGCKTTHGVILAIHGNWALIDTGLTPRTVQISDLTPTGGSAPVVAAEIDCTHPRGEVLAVHRDWVWVYSNGRPWVLRISECTPILKPFQGVHVLAGCLNLKGHLNLTLVNGITISGPIPIAVKDRFLLLSRAAVSATATEFHIRFVDGGQITQMVIPRKTEFTWI